MAVNVGKHRKFRKLDYAVHSGAVSHTVSVDKKCVPRADQSGHPAFLCKARTTYMRLIHMTASLVGFMRVRRHSHPMPDLSRSAVSPMVPALVGSGSP